MPPFVHSGGSALRGSFSAGSSSCIRTFPGYYAIGCLRGYVGWNFLPWFCAWRLLSCLSLPFCWLIFILKACRHLGNKKSGNNPSSIKLSSVALFHRPRSFPLFWGYCSPNKEKLPEHHCRKGIVKLPAYIQGKLRVQGNLWRLRKSTRINHIYTVSILR